MMMIGYQSFSVTTHQATKLMLILVDLASPRGAASASRWPDWLRMISGRRL